MELREVLGEELYKQVQTKIDEKNAGEPDKLKHIRYADLSEGNYVSKSKYDTALTEKANLEEQIKTLNTTINTLKTSNKDNEELQKTITQLQTDLKNQAAEHDKTLKNYSLKEKLTQAGVTDPDYIIYKAGGIEKFNFDKDGNPVGVEDSIKTFKEDKAMAHLFKDKETKPDYTPAGGGAGGSKNPFAKDSYNMTEQAQLFKTNPEQAKALAAAAGITI